MNKLAICIPVWNQWPYTNRALQDLSSLPENHKIIIVDNGSSDETIKLNSSGKIEVIKNNKNLGFAFASNQAFQKAVELGYENVMFLNNDIRVFSKEVWTDPLISAAQEGCIVGPTAGCLDENFNFICESRKLPTRGYGYISGWNMTASVATWQKLVLPEEIGPFASKSFVSYFEDTDLSLRAQKLGIELRIIDVPVKHIGRVTGKRAGLSDLYTQSRKAFIEIWGNMHN